MRCPAKILIVSASPILATGMGEVIRLIFGTLLDQYPGRYELFQVALFHSIPVAQPRWPVYPTRSVLDEKGQRWFALDDVDGQITFREVVSKLRPEIVFAFNDPQKVLHLCAPPETRQYKLILYVNFDGFPFPPHQAPILNQADVVCTMSKFSKRVARSCLTAINPSKLDHMYSPADTARFEPVTQTEKIGIRSRLLPDWMPRDAFLLGWVGRNQWRKQVWLPYCVIHHLRRGDYLICDGCGRVSVPCLNPALRSRDRQKEAGRGSMDPPRSAVCKHCSSTSLQMARPLANIFLWIHMPDEPALQDWDRSLLENLYEVKPGSDLHYTDGFNVENFKNPREMPLLYQILDCFLYLSGGEGFGLPPWEAMCSGLPVIYTNYSSHAEYLNEANAGLAVGGVLQPETKTCIWRMIADIPQVIESVRRLYFDRDLREDLGFNGRAFVEQYTPQIQVERWRRIFEKLISRSSAD